jgi:hypothetical protein
MEAIVQLYDILWACLQWIGVICSNVTRRQSCTRLQDGIKGQSAAASRRSLPVYNRE